MSTSTTRLNEICKQLALDLKPLSGNDITSRSPADGATLATLKAHSAELRRDLAAVSQPEERLDAQRQS